MLDTLESDTRQELEERKKIRLAEKDSLDSRIEMAVDLLEYRYYAASQARIIARLERRLRRLNDIHYAHECVRDAARDLELDSTTVAFAFSDWLYSLSDEDVERIRLRSNQRKQEWAGPL